ncbi:SNP47 protein, partial [Formicarius rufipectus]|nr:SNP47 protein [Formicarius rufipectus]
MNEDIHIHSWPCSYYVDSRKQWIPGRLSLTPVGISFTAGSTGELLVHLHLAGISEIKKESSSLIFSSLTILEKNTKHWFSSLQPNRNVVFNVLEHFWREQLLEGSRGAEAGAPRTSKGRELLGMMVGSQERLEDTARVLHYQGEQFDNIMKGLDKIEGDMDVADRLLTELESPSWWPFSSKLWKTPAECKAKGPATTSTTRQENPEEPLLRIPVIVTQGAEGGARPGELKLGPSGLEIRVGTRLLLPPLGARDLRHVLLHSPYEVSVWPRGPGAPCRLLSARMPRLVPLLRQRFGTELRCLEDGVGLAGAGGAPQGSSVWRAASELLGGVVPSGSASEGTDQEQVQLQQHQKVSQEEAKQLKQILEKLKGLALETEAELERQDEALDSISSSVDRATLSIDRHNRRMKRLT